MLEGVNIRIAYIASGSSFATYMTQEKKETVEQGLRIDSAKLSDLSDIYLFLKKDAKDMLFDFLEGVSLWRSAARSMLFFSIVSFVLGVIFVWGSTSTNSPIETSIFLIVIAIFLFGLAIVTLLLGIRYRKKYLSLRRKYLELYESASKLS